MLIGQHLTSQHSINWQNYKEGWNESHMLKFQLLIVCTCFENCKKLSLYFHKNVKYIIHVQRVETRYQLHRSGLAFANEHQPSESWEVIHAWSVYQVQMFLCVLIFPTHISKGIRSRSQNSLYYQQLQLFSPSQFFWSLIFRVVHTYLTIHTPPPKASVKACLI